MTQYEGKTAKDIRSRMETVMANRGEGLILKHPEAEYVLNGRNKDWIKVRSFTILHEPSSLNLPAGQT